MKIFLMFLMMFMVTGCSNNDEYEIDYELVVGTNYSEKITFYLPKNAYEIAENNQDDEVTKLEYNLLYNDIRTNITDDNLYYDKKITKKINYIKAQLEHTYTEHEFLYSQYINNCFENYELLSYENNFELKLSGQFTCYENYDVNILLKTDYEFLSNNGVKTDEGYEWKITRDNYLNTDIHFSLLRDYDVLDKKIIETKEENYLLNNLVILIVGITLIGGLLFFYKKYKR